MRTNKRGKKRVRINRIRIIVTVISVVLIAVVGMSVKNIFDLRSEQKQLKNNNKELLEQKAGLQAELENISDYGYIEEQARIQLRLIKPGEILYIINNNKAGSSKTDSSDNSDGGSQPEDGSDDKKEN